MKQRRILLFLGTVFLVMASSAPTPAGQGHRLCRHLRIVKRAARHHRLPLGTLRRLSQLYCKKGSQKQALARHKIPIYRSDNCSSNLVAIVGPDTDCGLLSRRTKAWAIKYRGRCINITDTHLRKACVLYKGAQFPTYPNDNCSGIPVAILGDGSHCSQMPKRTSAWSVKMGRRCVNIKDIKLPRACHHFQVGGSWRRAVKIYANDRCQKDLVALVGPNTQCHQLKNGTSTSAWAIKLGSRCIDITDMLPSKACRLYGGGENELFANDGCSGTPLAIVGPRSQCHTLPRRNVGSMRQNGRCIDIADTTIARACEQFAKN